MSLEFVTRQFQNVDKTIELLKAIRILDNAIMARTISEIKFSIYADDGELPGIDVSALDYEGIEIFGDLNFSTLQEAIIAIAREE